MLLLLLLSLALVNHVLNRPLHWKDNNNKAASNGSFAPVLCSVDPEPPCLILPLSPLIPPLCQAFNYREMRGVLGRTKPVLDQGPDSFVMLMATPWVMGSLLSPPMDANYLQRKRRREPGQDCQMNFIYLMDYSLPTQYSNLFLLLHTWKYSVNLKNFHLKSIGIFRFFRLVQSICIYTCILHVCILKKSFILTKRICKLN